MDLLFGRKLDTISFMIYERILKGRFLERPNRFVALVELSGTVEICHVKNTGRCKELLVPGAVVYVQEAQNPARKTKYDLIAVEKGARVINMDAAAPNGVFGEWAREGRFLPGTRQVRQEQVWEDSRLDFLVETEQGRTLVEVKGVTLEEHNVVKFPDAPTQRGVKHIETLCRAKVQGIDACLFFVIQMEGVRYFEPNDETHPAFGAALRRAASLGVRLMAYDCTVTPERIALRAPVEIQL